MPLCLHVDFQIRDKRNGGGCNLKIIAWNFLSNAGRGFCLQKVAKNHPFLFFILLGQEEELLALPAGWQIDVMQPG